jgi:hypothetical protein
MLVGNCEKDAIIAHLRAVIEEAWADLVRIKYDANQGWLGAVQGRIESLQSVLAKAEEAWLTNCTYHGTCPQPEICDTGCRGPEGAVISVATPEAEEGA